MAAIDSGELQAEGDLQRQLEAINHGLWAVTIGNAYINYVITPESMREEHAERLERDMRRHVIALFRGYGWNTTDPGKVYDEVADRCARLAVDGGDPS